MLFDNGSVDGCYIYVDKQFYKQLKGTELNKFTDEEKEAIDVLTNGRSEEFFKKIRIINIVQAQNTEQIIYSNAAKITLHLRIK